MARETCRVLNEQHANAVERGKLTTDALVELDNRLRAVEDAFRELSIVHGGYRRRVEAMLERFARIVQHAERMIDPEDRFRAKPGGRRRRVQ